MHLAVLPESPGEMNKDSLVVEGIYINVYIYIMYIYIYICIYIYINRDEILPRYIGIQTNPL